MIIGVGADIVEVKRIKEAVTRNTFLTDVYTDAERSMIESRGKELSYAGNYAAKEAVVKALGTGFSGFKPLHVEVLRDDNGKPYVNLYDGALLACAKSGATKIHVSITDINEYAAAFAVAEDI